MFVNSSYFTEAANHFKKYGRYADGDYDTPEWHEYWTEEHRRVHEGYTVGGTTITGRHYLYVNYLPIERIINKDPADFSVHKTKAKHSSKVGQRDLDFPSFWDEDFILFHTWDIAKYGADEEHLKMIEKAVGMTRIPIVRTEENLSGGKHHLWLKPRGVGAPQPLNEIVITPSGERKIGDLVIGDLVIGRNGISTPVLQIYEQESQDVYELVFSDGRKVRCGLHHTWTFLDSKTYTQEEFTVEELLKKRRLKGKVNYKYYLPKTNAATFDSKQPLKLHPYILGLFINAEYKKEIKITLNSEDELDYFNQCLSEYEITKNIKYKSIFKSNKFVITIDKNHSTLIYYLNKYNIGESPSFIKLPKEFIYTSITNRKELLKGLISTSSSLGSNNRTLYLTFKSKLLADDILYLLRSLGFNSKVSTNREKIKPFSVSFTTNEREYILNPNIKKIFDDRSRLFDNRVGLKEINKLNYRTPMRCIGVNNSDHLYLTKDFVPTHNSWKGAVIPVYNQFFGRKNNKSFLVADREKFLLGDGIFMKYIQHTNSLNKYGDGTNDDLVHGFKRNFLSVSSSDMSYRAGYTVFNSQGQKVTRGKNTLVTGLIIDGNPNNARGGRGDYIYEEFGSFRRVDETWNISRSSTEENGVVFGTQYGFGTGGDEGAEIEPLTKMFNDPKSYNILEFENIWDKDFMGLRNAYFTPAYINITHIDKDGNSDVVAGKEYYDKEREKLSESTDATVLPKHKAEKPYTPAEALSQSGNNIFPTELLNKHYLYLINTGEHKKAITTGELSRSEDGVVTFKPNPNLTPYIEFPVIAKSDKKSAFCILQSPFKNKFGRVPKNLYRIAVDPYRHDTTSGNSIGSFEVIENINRITPSKGDKIVAWYRGRPDRQEEFNEMLFNAAILYNCKIAPETDEPGGIIDYAKVHKLKHYLEPQFELAYDTAIKTKRLTDGKVGMHISSGKNDLRKKQGDKYIQEWLLRKRGIDLEGNEILNLHTIMDIGLLLELINYKDGINVDRVSSLRINMYYEREFIYKEVKIQDDYIERDIFFNIELF